tara:strand:+ start:151 stop:465 length:315 start_codon:yes stop_codon:yes gene_type:complete
MSYDLGDTLICEGGTKIIVFMTFYINKSINDNSSLGGFWGTNEKLTEVTPYYLEGSGSEEIGALNSKVSNVMGRGNCLLIEKDLNSQIQSRTAKKFASILLKHL